MNPNCLLLSEREREREKEREWERGGEKRVAKFSREWGGGMV